MDIPAQGERENLLFLYQYVLVGPSMDWMMPTSIAEDGYSLLSLLIQMSIHSRNTLTDTPRNNVLFQSGHP